MKHHFTTERVALGLTAAGLTAFWSALIVYVLLGTIQNHAFEYTPAGKQRVVAVTPQGWAFFTKSPRDPEDQWLVLAGGKWQRAAPLQSDPRNLFGLRKGRRAREIERGALLMKVKADAWTDCPQGLSACVKAGRVRAVEVVNPSPYFRVCGRMLVVRQPPVPWAWSKSLSSVEMASRAVLLDVRCDRTPARAA